jgi:hypothetical protein
MTGRWTDTNIAEDSWIVLVDDLLAEETEATASWLAQRLQFSKEIARLTEPGQNKSLLLYRPCDRIHQFEKLMSLSETIPYSTLRSDEEISLLHQAEDRISEIAEYLLDLLPGARPTSFVITYADDYDLLFQAAQTSSAFFDRYCEDKAVSEESKRLFLRPERA